MWGKVIWGKVGGASRFEAGEAGSDVGRGHPLSLQCLLHQYEYQYLLYQYEYQSAHLTMHCNVCYQYLVHQYEYRYLLYQY